MKRHDLDVISAEIFESIEWFMKYCPDGSFGAALDSIVHLKERFPDREDWKAIVNEAHKAYKMYGGKDDGRRRK